MDDKVFTASSGGGGLTPTQAKIKYLSKTDAASTYETKTDAASYRCVVHKDRVRQQIFHDCGARTFLVWVHNARRHQYEQQRSHGNPPTTNASATNKKYVDDNFLSVHGGALIGGVSMSGQSITNVNPTPQNNNDALTKSYVDNAITLSGGLSVRD